MPKKINYRVFNKRNLLPRNVEENTLDTVTVYERDRDILWKAKELWNGLSVARNRRRRNIRFNFGDQWGDVIPDPMRHGHWITEKEAIMRLGREPLKANLIRNITRNIVGQFRNSNTEPIAVVSDSDETKIGEMMTIALQKEYKVNQCVELDAAALMEYLMSGCVWQRTGYGNIPTRETDGCLVYNVSMPYMFWNRIEDVRSWDISFVGQLHDYTKGELLAAFAKSDSDVEKLTQIYAGCTDDFITNAYENMSTRKIDNLDFFTTNDQSLCRVIEIWNKERKPMYKVHDPMTGEVNWIHKKDKKQAVDYKNAQRIAEAAEQGVLPEDVPTVYIMKYEPQHEYWYYRFMSPMGDVLMAGPSPYWHKQHPFVGRFCNNFDGQVHSFVEDIIDNQKLINQMLALNNFVISSGAKNPLIVNTRALAGQDINKVSSDYVKVGGVIGLDLPPGADVRTAISTLESPGAVAGSLEIINWMQQTINDISGVHGASQGKPPVSGTPAALYAQETQNAETNIADTLGSFDAFRTERDTKLMQLIAQYYDSPRYIGIAGNNYSEESKYYNPDKVRNVNMDINITQGAKSAAYRTVQDTLLMQLLQGGLITLDMFLESSSLPFRDRLMQIVKRKQEEVQQGQVSNMQLPDDVMQQIQAGINPQAMDAMQQGLMGN